MKDPLVANILIIEDEPIIARSIKSIVTNLGHQVVGIAYNSDKALDLLANRKPSLVLLDINLEGNLNGIQIADIINKKYRIPFIYITSFSDNITLNSAAQTLPYGYIVKPFEEQDLLTTIAIAIHRITNDQRIETRDGLNKKLDVRLSDKEYEILKDLIDGISNAQMAQKHFISLNTVKSHIKNIYTKLKTHNRAETVKKVLS